MMMQNPINVAPDGYLQNAQGHYVPLDKVKTTDALENDLVLKLLEQADELSVNIRRFKLRCFKEINAFLDLLAQEHNIAKGGKKGNVTMTSYDGRFKINISVAEFIEFGPSLQSAKDLIDQCIHKWSDGSNDNIRALVDHAFRVDKTNRVNTKDILGLRRLDIRDDEWKQAMDVISESIRVRSSKEYVRFYYRPEPESDWKSIALDIAKV